MKLPKISERGTVALFILLPLLVIIAFIPMPGYLLHLVILAFLYGSLGMLWNLVRSSGQMLFGQSIFFGLGAYTSSILFERYGLTPWVGMLAGSGFAVLFAVLVGWPTFRVGLKGSYFAMATFAMNEILRHMALSFKEITNGALGISLTHSYGLANMQFISKKPYYIIVLAIMLSSFFVIYILKGRKFGIYIRAIREDEDAALTLGINTTLYKTLALCVCASLTAIVGSFYAQYVFFISPSNTFYVMLNFEVIGLALIGGTGVFYGPLIGALIMKPFTEYLRFAFGVTFIGLHLAVYGVVLMAFITFLPRGMYGSIKEAYDRLRGRGK